MTDSTLISVEVPYDNTDESGVREYGKDLYWAVRPPRDRWTVETPEGQSATDDDVAGPTPFRIMGSEKAVVYNKASIQGFRELLDRIEVELDE